jgi:hypothetical protein
VHLTPILLHKLTVVGRSYSLTTRYIYIGYIYNVYNYLITQHISVYRVRIN